MQFIIVTLAAAGCITSVYAFAPGLMNVDAISIYESAHYLAFDDWHSPWMQAIWALMDRLVPGPLGMLLVIQVHYWMGFALIGVGLVRRGWSSLGVVILLLAAFPPSLHTTGILLKDSLMAAFFLSALGLMMLSTTVAWRTGALVGSAAFLCLGIAMRPNAFAAAFPLIVLWLSCLYTSAPRKWWAWGAAGLAAVSLFLVITQAEHVVLNPKQRHVERSLMIFDLGGITNFTGKDQFGGVFGPGFVERNATSCYNSMGWDPYAWWGRCKDVVEGPWTPEELRARWLSAIAHEPVGYLLHRTKHFGLLLHARGTSSTVTLNRYHREHPPAVAPEFAAALRTYGAVPFIPSALYSLIERGSWTLPPIVWCLVLVGTLGLAALIRDGFITTLVVCLAISGLSYIGLYFLVGVSVDWRYGYWAQVAATISLAACAFAVPTAGLVRQPFGLRP
jgi:hypothetical protein